MSYTVIKITSGLSKYSLQMHEVYYAFVIIFLLLKFWFYRGSNPDHRRHRVYTLYLKASKVSKHL